MDSVIKAADSGCPQLHCGADIELHVRCLVSCRRRFPDFASVVVVFRLDHTVANQHISGVCKVASRHLSPSAEIERCYRSLNENYSTALSHDQVTISN